MQDFLDKFIPRRDRPAFIFIAAAGIFSHFLYGWTGSAFTALFCPVNESAWEHLKMLFFPFLLWSVWYYLRRRPNASSYFYYRFFSVLCGMLAVITLFYTYTGVIGRHFLPANILIYLVGITVSLRLVPRLTKSLSTVPSITVTYTAWAALVLCFFIFTRFPPEIPLFFPSP